MTIWLPTVAGPTDLPDLRAWLLEHWRPGTAIYRYFAESEWLNRTLKAASLWWVEPDTCQVLADSAPTIPVDTVLDLHDLPTPAGLAVFAHNLEGIESQPEFDVLGGKVRVSAVMWGPITIGISDARGWRSGEVYEAISIASFSRSIFRDGTIDDEDLIRAQVMLDVIGGRDRYPTSGDLFSYLGRADWLPGACPDTPLPGDEPVDPRALASKAEDRRLVAALWALTRTKLIDVSAAPVPRPVRRRSERHGLDPTVRVLRLGGERVRRPASEPGEPSGREWHHSWIRSPHFRWQPYGKGRAQRKLILIPAHHVGDPNLPLLGADRVWRVVPPKGS